jgi:hypothetical protein
MLTCLVSGEKDADMLTICLDFRKKDFDMPSLSEEGC